MLDAFYADAATSATSLCVSLQRSEVSIKPGQAAQWTVTAWTKGGNVPGTTLRLKASPTSQVPEFSFGCGSDGGATCNLGTVYSGSSSRELMARISVPAADKTLTSVQLTASASAANLVKDPSVSVAVTVSKNGGSGAGSSSQGAGTGPGSSQSQLPVGSLPAIGGIGGVGGVGGIGGASSSLSPGGNASGLFPTINPSSVPSPGTAVNASERPVANSESLPIGTPVVDAQLLGLGALGVAFLLAATRLSVRRRAVPQAAGAAAVLAAGAPPVAATPAAAPAESGATAAPAEPDATEPPTRVDPPQEPESLDPDEDEAFYPDDEDDPFDEYGSLSAEPPTRPDPAIRDEDD